MSGKWPIVELGKIAEFRNGLNYTQTARSRAGLPIVGVKDFQSRSFVDFSELEELDADEVNCSNLTLEKNDILFVRSNGNRNLIGRSLFVRQMPPRRTTYSGFTIRLRLTDQFCDPRFYAYVLRGPLIRKILSSQGGGTNINNLNQGILSRLKVPRPELDAQRRVASILGAYDDLIEVNRRRILVLEEIARGLFRDRVQRPVRELPAPGGTSATTILPEGWRVSPLVDVACITMGQSPPSSELNQDGEGLVFHQGVSDFGTLFPGRRVFCEHLDGKRIAEDGDALFSVRAPVGRINCAIEKTVLGRGLASIGHREAQQAYLLAHLRATFHAIDLIGNGAIYRAVNRGDVERVPIVVPPPSVLTTLNAELEIILGLVRTLSSTNLRLADSRDLLLPRLITGELSIAAAERQMEAVV